MIINPIVGNYINIIYKDVFQLGDTVGGSEIPANSPVEVGGLSDWFRRFYTETFRPQKMTQLEDSFQVLGFGNFSGCDMLNWYTPENLNMTGWKIHPEWRCISY